MQGRIIRYIKTIFEQQEEDYYKPVRVDHFWIITISNVKVVVIEIKTYQWKNI